MAAPPPWTGLTFTSKLNSAPPPSLAPSSQRLPSPFVVAITGASRNIGAATAKAFAQAGATGLILTAATESDALLATKKDVEAAGTSLDLKVTVLAADISNPSSFAKLLADAISPYCWLDLLINNAAVVSTHPSAFNRLDAIHLDQITQTATVNYVGKVATIQALLPLLLRTPGGAKTIVNVTSALSHFASMGAIGYNISELATNRLTEAVAESYGAVDGILAHAVHPGIVKTLPRPIRQPAQSDAMAVDDVGLCGAFLVWLVQERRPRPWLSGRYVSANWDVEEPEGKKDAIVGGRGSVEDADGGVEGRDNFLGSTCQIFWFYLLLIFFLSVFFCAMCSLPTKKKSIDHAWSRM